MNNSDPQLSPAEEQLMACLDGRLSPEDAAAFEQANPGAAQEKSALAKVGDALRLHGPAPALRNSEFFNRQILREITPPSPAESAPPALWKLWRLAFAGACCALAAVGIYKAAVAPDTLQAKYFAEVLSVKAGDSQLTAQVINAEGLAVVWIDGFDELPRDYVLE